MKLAQMLYSKKKVLDQRSYKISSEKIYNKLGFKTKKTIKNAIDDLVEAFTKKISQYFW